MSLMILSSLDIQVKLGVILAQAIEDPQVFEKMQEMWNNFVQSGQVWALIIGIVLGYLFRSFTAY